MQITTNVRKLKWLLNFTNEDLTDNRGLQNLILTKIIDKYYVIATDGHAAIFWKVNPINPLLNLDRNLCVYFDKKDLLYLKSLNDNVMCSIDFLEQKWKASEIELPCKQLHECNINFQNWLQWNFITEQEMENKDKYQHIINLKDLSKFCIDKDKKVIIYPINKRTLLIKIPDELDKFGFISKINENCVKISDEFENLVESFNINLKNEIKEKLG